MTTDPDEGARQTLGRLTRARYQVGAHVRERATGKHYVVVGFEDYGARLLCREAKPDDLYKFKPEEIELLPVGEGDGSV